MKVRDFISVINKAQTIGIYDESICQPVAHDIRETLERNGGYLNYDIEEVEFNPNSRTVWIMIKTEGD